MQNHNKPQGTPRIGSSAVLGRRLIVKHGDDSAGRVFRTIDNTGIELAEMLDYPGPMAVLIESLERQGVRLTESDLMNCDVTYDNQYVMVIRGKSAEFLSRLHECLESGMSAQESLQCARLVRDKVGCSRWGDHPKVFERVQITHKRSLPNDQKLRSSLY